jgi:GntR family transcriptional repressor for pyruvate dehydrogenase complex
MPSASSLAELIERDYVAGHPGKRLPSERELAQRLQVGRPLVREALRALAERGVVDIHAGRGTFVRRVAPADAARPLGRLLGSQAVTTRQVVEARSMLEQEASRLACQRASPEELAHMRELVTVALPGARSLIARVRYDLSFHLSVVRAAHNPVIETMFCAILHPVAEMMLRSLSDPQVTDEGLPFHEGLYLAICRRDADAAAQVTREHLAVSKRTYGADYDVDLRGLAGERLVGFVGSQGWAGTEAVLSSAVEGALHGQGREGRGLGAVARRRHEGARR